MQRTFLRGHSAHITIIIEKRGLRHFALLRSPYLRRIRPGHRPRLPLARHLLWVLHAALEEEGAPLARAREQHGLARGAVGIVAHAVRLGKEEWKEQYDLVRNWGCTGTTSHALR